MSVRDLLMQLLLSALFSYLSYVWLCHLLKNKERWKERLIHTVLWSFVDDTERHRSWIYWANCFMA